MKYKVQLYTGGVLQCSAPLLNRLRKANKKLGEVIEIDFTESRNRSLPELRFYWIFCKYASDNMPEYIPLPFGLQWNDKLLHAVFKQKADIDSVSFNELEEAVFNRYFQDCIEYFANEILHCEIKDLQMQFNDYKDILK